MRASPLPAGDPRHGTPNGYVNLGCRCDACRKAQTAYLRERGYGTYRRDACGCGKPKTLEASQCQDCYIAENEPEHGTESRYCGGCRCDLCMDASATVRDRRYADIEAARAYDREYKRRRQRAQEKAS